MVAVKFKDWRDAVAKVRESDLQIYEEMFANDRAYVYHISKGRLTTDTFVYVTDTTQPMRHELVDRLHAEGRSIRLAIKEPHVTIEQMVDYIRNDKNGKRI